MCCALCHCILYCVLCVLFQSHRLPTVTAIIVPTWVYCALCQCILYCVLCVLFQSYRLPTVTAIIVPTEVCCALCIVSVYSVLRIMRIVSVPSPSHCDSYHSTYWRGLESCGRLCHENVGEILDNEVSDYLPEFTVLRHNMVIFLAHTIWALAYFI